MSEYCSAEEDEMLHRSVDGKSECARSSHKSADSVASELELQTDPDNARPCVPDLDFKTYKARRWFGTLRAILYGGVKQ